jgi:hypothetical protein
MKPPTLKDLTPDERTFYQLAVKKYRANVDWLAFEEYAFGMRSPIYQRQRSHLDVIDTPLYVALREMWLDLGVKQGMVAPGKQQEKRNAKRGRKAGSGKAADKRNRSHAGDMAAADSPARERLSKSRG